VTTLSSPIILLIYSSLVGYGNGAVQTAFPIAIPNYGHDFSKTIDYLCLTDQADIPLVILELMFVDQSSLACIALLYIAMMVKMIGSIIVIIR